MHQYLLNTNMRKKCLYNTSKLSQTLRSADITNLVVRKLAVEVNTADDADAHHQKGGDEDADCRCSRHSAPCTRWQPGLHVVIGWVKNCMVNILSSLCRNGKWETHYGVLFPPCSLFVHISYSDVNTLSCQLGMRFQLILSISFVTRS